MYLFYADEADQDGAKEFFVYAAAFIPSEAALPICERVEKLRISAGYLETDPLKFSPRSKPEQVSREDHAQIKNDVLELAREFEVKVCCQVTPHVIATNQGTGTTVKWGANTLIGKFDQFLSESGKLSGVALFDRHTFFDQFEHFREIHQLGLDFDGKRSRLEGICSMAIQSDGSSHLASLADIVVGALRWAVNEPEKDKVGSILLKLVAPLFWGKVGNDGVKRINERGFCIRPLNIKHDGYRADVEALRNRLISYLT